MLIGDVFLVVRIADTPLLTPDVDEMTGFLGRRIINRPALGDVLSVDRVQPSSSIKELAAGEKLIPAPGYGPREVAE